MSLNFPRVAFGGVILTLVLGSDPVFAADAKAIADAFVAVTMANGDNQTTYGSATATGDDVTITDLKSVNTDGGTVTIPSIVITGAQPRDKGGFTASKFTFDNTSIVSNDSTITWKTGSATDVTIPSPEEAKAKAKIRPFATLAIADSSVTSADMAAPVAIGGINVGIDMDDAGIPRDFTMKVDAIKLPPELFANEPQQKAVLDALGYSGFTINVDVAGGYETANDTLTMRNFTIDALDVGKLDIDGKFSSVPLSKLAGGDPDRRHDQRQARQPDHPLRQQWHRRTRARHAGEDDGRLARRRHCPVRRRSALHAERDRQPAAPGQDRRRRPDFPEGSEVDHDLARSVGPGRLRSDHERRRRAAPDAAGSSGRRRAGQQLRLIDMS